MNTITRRLFNYLLLVTLSLTFLSSCVSRKKYDTFLLNDRDMNMQQHWSSNYDHDAWQYREGSSGATGTNTGGGGCGCN